MNCSIKSLGDKIIQEHNLTDDFDVITKWMIFYIAEQMRAYDSAKTEDEKRIAGERCSDAIRKFWGSRSFNTMWYPLSNYKELYDGLIALIADDLKFGIIDDVIRKTSEGELKGNLKKLRKVTQWLTMYMIEDCYSRLYEEGDDEWVNLISEYEGGYDARILDIIAETKGHEDVIIDILEEQIAYIEDTVSMCNNLLEHKKQLLVDAKETSSAETR